MRARPVAGWGALQPVWHSVASVPRLPWPHWLAFAVLPGRTSSFESVAFGGDVRGPKIAGAFGRRLHNLYITARRASNPAGTECPDAAFRLAVGARPLILGGGA